MEFMTMKTYTTIRRLRRARWARLVSVGLAFAWAGCAAAQPDPVEYGVKAAYLSKFGLFVDWPATAFSASISDLRICVVGEDPFGTQLDQAVSNKNIGGHPLAVTRLKTITPQNGCHIAYVGGSENESVRSALDALRGGSVLTVTDSRSSASAIGIVHFVVSEDRVRFDIDDAAAEKNGLGVSSKLLNLARDVRRR